MPRTKILTMAISALVLLVLLGAVSISCAGPASAYDGQRLGDCPSSPNCVCSEVDPAAAAYVAPWPIPHEVTPEAAFEALAGLVSDQAVIQTREAQYFHAVFTTRWLRFKDDLEARLDPAARVIHVRSASRLGHSDFGANRARVNKLRAALTDSLQ